MLYQRLIEHYNISIQFITYGSSSDRNWESELRGIKLYPVYERLPFLTNKLLSFFQTFFIPIYFNKELRDADIYKTNQIWGGWVAVISKWLYRKPLLVRCGYDAYKNSLKSDNKIIKQLLIKYTSWLTYNQANHVLLTTEEISSFVQNTFGVSESTITVFPNWIDTAKFSDFDSADKTSNRILFVGRLSEEKNIPLLIYSLVDTDIELDIVGHGELKKIIYELSTSLGVKVNFLDCYPNNKMPDIYNRYLVYVLCSKYEGNPKTLLEAMSCGCAVIGTDVVGIRDVIEDNKSGILVKEDVGDLRDIIRNLLSNQSLCKNLGSIPRSQIVKNNSLEALLEIECNIYDKLLCQP